MSKATHQFEIRGVDKSAGAFASVKAKAAATGAQIKSMVGGAIAAAGAYLGFQAIKGGIDELGRLSNVAQKANVSVDALTSATAAFGALGVQMNADSFAKSMSLLAKNTGRTGMEGFYQTIAEIGKIPDVSKRAEAAMKVFGKSGLEFMPLINAADEGVDALRTVVAAMPKVSQAAANAGDGAADAMGFAANEVKSLWLEGLGFLANKLNNDYTGDVRTAALTAGNALTYWTKLAVAKCITYWEKLKQAGRSFGEVFGAVIGATSEKLFGSGGSWSDVWKEITNSYDRAMQEYDDRAEELEKVEEERAARFQKNYEDRARAIKHFADNYNKAAVSIDARKKKDAASAELGKMTKISNDLVMGGSNAALKMQILGPTYQSEQKKQTSLLEKIAANTEQTADNTEETFSGFDFERVN